MCRWPGKGQLSTRCQSPLHATPLSLSGAVGVGVPPLAGGSRAAPAILWCSVEEQSVSPWPVEGHVGRRSVYPRCCCSRLSSPCPRGSLPPSLHSHDNKREAYRRTTRVCEKPAEPSASSLAFAVLYGYPLEFDKRPTLAVLDVSLDNRGHRRSVFSMCHQ